MPPTDSRNNQTDKISTPVTPDQRFKARHLRINSVEPSPDGGVALWPSDSTYRHPSSNNNYTDHGTAQLTAATPRPSESTQVLASPSRLANIRIRRSHHGSVLLQSPARAGHAARMRQIFEDASLEQQTPQTDRGALYPQLPNVSRRASSPTEHNGHAQNQTQRSSCVRGPESLCTSTSSVRPIPHRTQVSFTGVSEQSSESWSDDSGYFITGSRNRSSTLTFAPNDRIAEWLTDVSTPQRDEHSANGQEDYDISPGFCQHFPSDFGDNKSKSTKQPQTRRPVRLVDADPFLTNEYIYGELGSSLPFSSLFGSIPDPWEIPTHPPPTNAATQPTVTIRPYPRHSPTKHDRTHSEGGIQLSPLSPNVCVERGPSRYHSSRNLRDNDRASPTKTRCGPLKENVTVDHGEAKDDEHDTPTAPCKIGVGTRFQHPRHTARKGLGRWARRDEP